MLQVFVDHLSGSVSIFIMRFIAPKCKMLLPDCIGSKPNFVLTRERLGEVGRPNYLDSCNSSGGRISGEVSSRVQKGRLAFTNLNHLWLRRDIRLSMKVRV